MIHRSLVFLLTTFFIFWFSGLCFAENISNHHSPTSVAPDQLKTIDGMLLKIEGQTFLLLDRAGKENQIHVDQSTKRLGREKRPGDMVRAQVTENGYAISIQ